MKCPHCATSFHESWNTFSLGEKDLEEWHVSVTTCPACGEFVIHLTRQSLTDFKKHANWMVYPKGSARPALPTSVPEEFAADYREACLVSHDSPKASAALSRRCLQHLLREKAGVKHSDLSKEIQEVIDSGQLPSHLADAIDAVRNHGNFAAHPLKSRSTGEVVDVEPGEAEWNLDVLEGLFDHYFVQPAILEAKRAALNAKLADLGKPEMKSAEAAASDSDSL
jgi:Domain of unknown function (DUF4145)